MKVKILLGVAALVIVTFCIGVYRYSQSDEYIAKYGKTVYVDTPTGKVKVEHAGQLTQFDRKTEGKIVALSDGWSRYTVDDWVGFGFSYPSHWVVSEKEFNTEVVPLGGLSTLKLVGDGYTVSFTKIGRDLDTGVNTYSVEEIISGHNVVFYREKGYSAFRAVIKGCSGIGGVLSSPTGTREVVDKIITSLDCPGQ
ncbi:hypothetical protein K2Q00_02200 [Patescibacteria group bacterium]|nr:hypothetical protein [Patescibacteria group bacterium]